MEETKVMRPAVLTEQMKRCLTAAMENSLEARLGKVLVRGTDSVGDFLALPFRLCGMWWRLSMGGHALGGKSFQKVLDAYSKGGDGAVEQLLDSVEPLPTMRANAYTALASQCMPQDPKKAAEFAWKAWECDPRFYRLKWLASRTYEAGDTTMAAVLFDLLPEDTPMSDIEHAQAERIRRQARQAWETAIDSSEREALRRELEEVRKQLDEEKEKVMNLRVEQGIVKMDVKQLEKPMGYEIKYEEGSFAIKIDSK